MTQFVVCFSTTDGKTAQLHAFRRGEGSLRDENHVGEIISCFCKGNENGIIHREPVEGERVLYEVHLTVENTRRNGSRYSGWDFRMFPGCPHCVAVAGYDIFRQMKRVLKNARRNKK